MPFRGWSASARAADRQVDEKMMGTPHSPAGQDISCHSMRTVCTVLWTATRAD